MLTLTKVRVRTFLARMKIPFLIASIVLVAIEFATSAIRAVGVTGLGTLTYVGAAIYAVISTLWHSYRVVIV